MTPTSPGDRGVVAQRPEIVLNRKKKVKACRFIPEVKKTKMPVDRDATAPIITS
jgi:hypothetical protein